MKVNSDKLPTQSKIACHILAIPATFVASEAIFSEGGRVIYELCASLLSKTVEALMTTKDWLSSLCLLFIYSRLKFLNVLT